MEMENGFDYQDINDLAFDFELYAYTKNGERFFGQAYEKLAGGGVALINIVGGKKNVLLKLKK